MASDEEYLDGLMKSLMDADPDQNDTGSGGEDPLMDPDSADFFGGIDSAASQVEDDEEWVARLDDLLMSAESMNQKDGGSGADSGRSSNPSADTKYAEGGGSEEGNAGAQHTDLATGSGVNLDEVSKKPEENESADDDMNSLLDSIQMLDVEEKDSGKEKKKKKFKFPWGKKNKESEDDSGDQAQGAKPKEMRLKDIEKGKEGEKKRESAFGRFLDLLFEEEEEEEPQKEEKPKSENDELLKQLEKEDGGAKKGKDKKKSKKEKKEKKPPKEKKKKEKKEKKKPEPKPEKIKEKEPPSKPIGKKNLILVFAFCLSILVAVLLLNMVITDFALKQDTQKAAEEGNYSEIYQLLYGKELNEEETQLFNKATLVLQMERKLDIYEFYKEAGDRVRALDALLQGTKRYQELTSADTYGASDELLRIYQVILEYLNLDYGISEERAAEINSFEGRDYRRKIYSAAGGTDSEALANEAKMADAQQENLPGEASSGEDVPLDLLPEEEDILDLEPQTEGE